MKRYKQESGIKFLLSLSFMRVGEILNYIEQNKAEFERCGILLWHSKGFAGQGIKVAEIESAIPTLPFFNGKLHDPFNISTPSDINSHGQLVLDVMCQILPDADLYMLPADGEYSSTYAKGTFVDKVLSFIISEGIDIVGASLPGINNEILNKKILEVQNHGNIFVCSAGNKGTSGLGDYANSNIWISVGALGLDKYNNIYLKDYSSRGQALDFCVFSELYVRNGENGQLIPYPMEGTSFSSPMLIGMIGLVQQFFFEKTGKKLNQEQIYQFVKDYCVDLGDKLFDVNYGWGQFVLPNPDDIDIKKYIPEYMGDDNMKIVMKIGSKEINCDGNIIISDVAPFIKENRTFLPVRILAETLGCEVLWDEKTQTVTILK